MASRADRDRMWAEARRRCHLSPEAITMAKELGLSPRSLMKNMPSRSEPWKAPVEAWVRELYARRQTRTARAGHDQVRHRPGSGS